VLSKSIPLLVALTEGYIGGYSLTYFDEFIDEMMTKDRVCDIILPRLTQRSVLEETEGLPPRKSLLVRGIAHSVSVMS
jgi:pre-mRNA-splicing factor 38A